MACECGERYGCDACAQRLHRCHNSACGECRAHYDELAEAAPKKNYDPIVIREMEAREEAEYALDFARLESECDDRADYEPSPRSRRRFRYPSDRRWEGSGLVASMSALGVVGRVRARA